MLPQQRLRLYYLLGFSLQLTAGTNITASIFTLVPVSVSVLADLKIYAVPIWHIRLGSITSSFIAGPENTDRDPGKSL